MTPQISVIIPVYNVEGKIVRCLESLRGQTLRDIEIVLVDDHGRDDSMSVARGYADAHPEMNLVFADNGSNKGPGAARNLGIKSASGEFVAFVDSDDWIDAEFCRSLYDAAIGADAQLAYCHVSFDYSDGHSEIHKNPLTTDKKAFLIRYKSYFWTFIYKRSFLLDNGISFPGTYSAEDTCFLLSALLMTEQIAHVDAAMYHYIIENSSISHKKDRQRWKSRLKSMRAVRQFARSHNVFKDNRLLIEWLCFKKGTLMAFKDIITNF